MRSVQDRLLGLISAYEDEHGHAPARLYISRADEHELEALPASMLGAVVASNAAIEGIRVALPSLDGVPIVWDAEESGVSDE